MTVDTADEKIARRSAVESEFNGLRDQIEKDYVQAKTDLENQYHEDIIANRKAKESAMLAVDLNPDGSDPQGRQQGSTL